MEAATAAVHGVAPDTVLQPGEKVDVKHGRSTFEVRRTQRGDSYTCQCPTWRLAKVAREQRTCSHLSQVLGAAYEARRVQLAKAGEAPVVNRLSNSAARDTAAEGASSSGGAAGAGKRKADDDVPVGRTRAAKESRREVRSAEDLMLGSAWQDDRDPEGMWISEKLDGVRAWWDGKVLQSRRGKTWNAPEWFKRKLPTTLHLDGELWIRRDAFELTSGICRRANQNGWIDINFMVFDVTNLTLVYEERLKELARRLPDGEMSPDEVMSRKKGGHVCVLPVVRCLGREHLARQLKQVLEIGGEGLMLRKPGTPYVAGRGKELWKLKSWYEAEAKVVGHRNGENLNARRMGCVVCQMENGNVFDIGLGFTDDMRERWWPPRGTIVRYRFQDILHDGVPRFPIFEGVCADKTQPKDAVVRNELLRAAGVNGAPSFGSSQPPSSSPSSSSSSRPHAATTVDEGVERRKPGASQ